MTRVTPGGDVATVPSVLLGLNANHVLMTAGEAEDIARTVWSIDAQAVRLATEKDDTFRLSRPYGPSFVLKVSHPAEAVEEIAFECQVIRHAGARGLLVPEVIPTQDGQLYAGIRDSAGQHRVARLLTYLDGLPLDATHSTAVERERVGEALAALRLALADFPSDTSRRCAWDISNLPELRPLLEWVLQPAQAALLRRGFERYMEAAAPRVPMLRRQILHNDFSKSNIIVDHDDPGFVTGIIDFGDTVHTAIAIDVSTAMLNQLPADAGERQVDDLLAEGRDLLRGYLRHVDLTDDELAIIPHLVMGRIVARALITLYRAQHMPHNRKYILRNTDQGWGQLAWFLDRPAEDVARLLT